MIYYHSEQVKLSQPVSQTGRPYRTILKDIFGCNIIEFYELFIYRKLNVLQQIIVEIV